MTKTLPVFFYLIISLLPFPCFGYQVFIDAGHGGNDLGTIQKNIYEKDLVLQFSFELKEILEKDKTFSQLNTLHLSRESDQTLSLAQRVEKAHQLGADLYLSFHANSTIDAKARGIEIFFRQPNHHSSRENSELDQTVNDLKELGELQQSVHFSQILAHNIRENQNELRKTPVTLKQAPFYVISKSEIPAVLIEIGFLTHPREKQKLLEKSYRQEMAQEIVRSLQKFISSQKEFSDKTSSKSLD